MQILRKMRFWSNEKLSDQDVWQINFEWVIFQWTIISFPPGEEHPIGLVGGHFFDHPVVHTYRTAQTMIPCFWKLVWKLIIRLKASRASVYSKDILYLFAFLSLDILMKYILIKKSVMVNEKRHIRLVLILNREMMSLGMILLIKFGKWWAWLFLSNDFLHNNLRTTFLY